MLFNSVPFLLFMPLVFIAYWLLQRWTTTAPGLRAQNVLLLGASYAFYGWWDVRFLGLIALSTVVDYAAGLGIQRAQGAGRRGWLAASLLFNLGLLGYFKYANFAADNEDASIGQFFLTRGGSRVGSGVQGADGGYAFYSSNGEQAFKDYAGDVARATLEALDTVYGAGQLLDELAVIH